MVVNRKIGNFSKSSVGDRNEDVQLKSLALDEIVEEEVAVFSSSSHSRKSDSHSDHLKGTMGALPNNVQVENLKPRNICSIRGMLFPSIYYEGSPDYNLKNDSYAVHASKKWIYYRKKYLYYNIKSRNYFKHSLATGAFIETNEILTDKILKKDEVELWNPNQNSNNNKQPSLGKRVGGGDNPEEGVFYINLESDITFHTAEIPSIPDNKGGREDRHVTVDRIPLDSISDTQGSCLFSAVFDGHGGVTCVEYCVSRMSSMVFKLYKMAKKKIQQAESYAKSKASNKPSQYLQKNPFSTDVESLRRALKKTFDLVNNRYLEIAKNKSLKDGCAAIVLIIYGPDEDGSLKLITAHVGDCRGVLYRDGKAIRLTEDHKPFKEKEKKRIESQGGQVVRVKGIWRVVVSVQNRVYGLSTSRSIGDLHLKVPQLLCSSKPDIHVYSADFYKDRFVILATDGVWDVIHEQEACEVVSKFESQGRTPQRAAEALVAVARARGSTDDKTATIIFFNWVKGTESTEVS